jgi:hypothetical protein
LNSRRADQAVSKSTYSQFGFRVDGAFVQLALLRQADLPHAHVHRSVIRSLAQLSPDFVLALGKIHISLFLSLLDALAHCSAACRTKFKAEGDWR